jgi:hypothetical protein
MLNLDRAEKIAHKACKCRGAVDRCIKAAMHDMTATFTNLCKGRAYLYVESTRVAAA